MGYENTCDFYCWQLHAAAANSLQSCPTLCDPIDGSPPGSRPWDSPGKNTGAGCHFLLQCMKVESESEAAQSCLTPCDQPHGLQPTMPLCPRDFPGKSTGVGRHCFLLLGSIAYTHNWKKCSILVAAMLLFSCWVMSNSETPWTVARQTPLSMGFPRQEYWSGFLFPPPGDLPDLGIKPCLLLGRQILYRWATWKASILVRG